MDKIIIKLHALNWTMGNVADFDLKLIAGTVEVDWGDGHRNTVAADKDWIRVNHVYSKKSMEIEEAFQIAVESELDDSIIGFRNGSVDMENESIDVSGCKSLEILSCPFMKDIDVSQNPNLEILDVKSAS